MRDASALGSQVARKLTRLPHHDVRPPLLAGREHAGKGGPGVDPGEDLTEHHRVLLVGREPVE
jgi:hypothetical protein